MTGWDFLKAVGIALAVLIANVAVSFGVVWVYATFIEPGHDEAFYQAAAQWIAPWSSVFAGAVLFFLALWWLAWRRQGRNGYVFAAAVVAIYAAIDVSVIAAVGALGAMGLIVAVSMASKLAGALLGAWLGRPRSA
jgi:hypothetical protein